MEASRQAERVHGTVDTTDRPRRGGEGSPSAGIAKGGSTHAGRWRAAGAIVAAVVAVAAEVTVVLLVSAVATVATVAVAAVAGRRRAAGAIVAAVAATIAALAPPAVALLLFAAPASPLHAQVTGGTADGEVTVRGEASAVEVALGDLRRLAACEGTAPSSELELQRLRSLYILALADEDRVEPAREHAAALILHYGDDGTPDQIALLRAYDGALTVLRAKHGFWPLGRVNHLRRGLRTLDREVEARPGHLEIRYLRLVSTAFLPDLFGRGDSARRDLEVVARLLAGAPQHLPSRTVQAMGDTVLGLLDADHPERAPVVAALERDRKAPEPLAPGCSG